MTPDRGRRCKRPVAKHFICKTTANPPNKSPVSLHFDQLPKCSTQAHLIHSPYCLNTVGVNAVVSVKLFGVTLADIELL